jgi:S-formylglutathione hydrolase FrmB
MAHLRCDFFSDALGLSTSMTVLLPQQTTSQIGLDGAAADGPTPVLYLLHGLSDDDTTWLRRTSIERYVAELGWAVVMPQVHRSFYTDEASGGRFWTFVSDELPSLVASFFRVSARREDTFVAGLSMGGYGALKLALRQPDRFAAAASLSGALDLAALVRQGAPRPEDPAMFDRIFGAGRSVGPDDDLLALLTRTDPAGVPALWVCCGTEDPLLPGNRAFAAACERAGVSLSTSWTAGEHEWGYWDDQIVDVLEFFQARRSSGTGAAE